VIYVDKKSLLPLQGSIGCTGIKRILYQLSGETNHQLVIGFDFTINNVCILSLK
jgi:hypothetical protein